MSLSIVGCDGICKIDLDVAVEADNLPDGGFVIGSSKTINMIFTITNW